MKVRIYKGKKINRFACLLCLGLGLAALGAAGVFALLEKPELGRTFCILAAICGSFSLLYGICWLVYGRAEKKKELRLRQVLERPDPGEDPYRMEYEEFILPREELIRKAVKRTRDIARWTGICAAGMFLLIGGIQWFSGSLKSPVQLLYTLLFCGLIPIPGLVLHGRLYRDYERTVPSRILLFPGKLVIDGESFSAREIRDIHVSPARLYNRDSPDVFREMLIRTEKGSTRCRIDHRKASESGDQPFWTEYGRFIGALSEWGTKNRVPVTVDYMA